MSHWLRRKCPRLQRVCTLCQTGNLGGEQHLVFGCSVLQGFKDRYNGLFWDHDATMVQFMLQHNTCAVALFVKEHMDAQSDPGPQSQGIRSALGGCE